MEMLKDLDDKTIGKLAASGRTLEEAIVEFFKYAVDDWDNVITIQVGAVTVSRPTAEKIVGSLRKQYSAKDVMMKWLNYGFSTLIPVADGKVLIDTDKIKYKETK